MALICLSSFLYYNSDYKIKIFCDQKLSKYTKYFKHFFRKFQIVIDDSIPNNKADPEKFYQDWLIRVGESVTTESVKIDFRKSDQTDWIEITRN